MFCWPAGNSLQTVCLVANLLLYVPARQTQFDMGLTDNKALDGNHDRHNDKSSINDGPG